MSEILLNDAKLKIVIDEINKSGNEMIDTHTYNFKNLHNKSFSSFLMTGAEVMDSVDDIIILYKQLNRNIAKAVEQAGQEMMNSDGSITY